MLETIRKQHESKVETLRQSSIAQQDNITALTSRLESTSEALRLAEADAAAKSAALDSEKESARRKKTFKVLGKYSQITLDYIAKN